jgi:hypothetical protein
LLSGCSASQAPDEENIGKGDDYPNYPAIDAAAKYFKPGPVTATGDAVERKRRLDYHRKVITAHGFNYTVSDTPVSHFELTSLAGFLQPFDSGGQKPKKMPPAKSIQLPAKWDWRANGAGIPPIRNQGQCGSCWAFGTTAAVEAAVAVFDKQIIDLSEQNVLDCSGVGTCGGGYWAYDLFINKGGVMEKDDPYSAYDQQCRNNVNHQYKIEAYKGIQSGNIDDIKAAIYQNGAVGVTMAVCGSFPSYSGGVYDSTECNNAGTNHIVALVGWDDTIKHRQGNGAWILRNSWATSWGDNGYAMIAYGMARIEDDATYVVYKPVDNTDTDKDGVPDYRDNCPTAVNADQKDADQDGKGDACDPTFDGFETAISLADDDSRKVDIGLSFPFYGTAYSEVYINSDGNITFGASDDKSANRDKTRFLSQAPRIAGLFADMNPAAGGKVTYGKTAPDTFFVKYTDVPRYDNTGKGSFTVTLNVSGEIVIAYGNVTGSGYFAGVSKGGNGNNAAESNLSAGQLGYGGTTALYQSFSSGGFGLSGKTVTIEPGNGPGPGPGPQPATETAIALQDDDSQSVPLGFSFPFYGTQYSDVHVNSDGNLTFGKADGETANRDSNRFLHGAPRLAFLYGDLDPSKSGAVTYRHDDPTSITIAYKDVPLYGSSVGNTVSITLHDTGRVDITYGNIGGSSYIVGVSKGGSSNNASSTQLSALAQPIGYGGTDTVFQAFSKQSPFNLMNKTISFSTDGMGPGPGPGPNGPTETALTLGDDDTANVNLGFTFPFFGSTYGSVFVNSDGNLTFGQGDGMTADRTLSRFLTGSPRIALFYADLDPSAGGSVTVRHDDAQTVTISYLGVPAWGSSQGNTAHVTLKSSGEIDFGYDAVSIPSVIVGVSRGGAGNAGSSANLASMQSFAYGDAGAVYEQFDEQSNPFNMTSLTCQK